MNIKTVYRFHSYYYLKNKIILLVLFSTNILYFNINCLVILFDFILFYIKISNIPI